MKSIFDKVRRHPKRIVFPEGEDERILQAAAAYYAEGLGAPIVLGPREAILKKVQQLKLDFRRIRIIDPSKSEDLESFAATFISLRKGQRLGREEALQAVKQPVYFATIMLLRGNADGLVAGVNTTAAAILRPLFQTIRLEPGIKAASSCSVIQLEDSRYGQDGILYFADCGVIPDPTADQLADIALMAAKLARQLHGVKPRVAFLSYSTKGSGRHKSLQKILAAVALARQRASAKSIEAEFDGELQVDAALIPEIAAQKAPHSPVAGKANVFIFPDLNAGNISTKLLQCLCRTKIYGPILVGLSKSASDLFRNCSTEEILGAAAIVALQTVEYRKIYAGLEKKPPRLPRRFNPQ